MLGAMSLSLIVGPPNSGKAGEVLARLKAALDRDPVLIVPTLDDADRFERELCEGAGNGDPVLGVSIRTFERLFEDVAQATGTPLPPTLSDEQRLYAVRLATRRANPRILGRSAAARGSPGPSRRCWTRRRPPASIRPVSRPAQRAVSPQSAYLREIAALYTAYAETRDTLGYGDDHVAAARGHRGAANGSDAWSARPVLVYGFDDLTVEQLELLSALAEASEVTVSVAYGDRDAFVARAHLCQELRERGGESEPPLEPNPANTVSQTLFRLERCLLRERTDRIRAGRRPGADGGGRRAWSGRADRWPDRSPARRRGEAGEIAVVLRSPIATAPCTRRAGGLRRPGGGGGPCATRTAVGRGLISLLRGALTSQSAEDVLAFVRTPSRHAGDADWLERTMRRRGLQTAAEALEAWTGRPLFEFDELAKRRQPEELLRVVAGLARRIGEQPHKRRARWQPSRSASSCALPASRPRPSRPWPRCPTSKTPPEGSRHPGGPRGAAVARTDRGHVRVTSPYRIRARRVTHLFVASLQEGEFPRHDAGEPFLSDEQRGALGLPPGQGRRRGTLSVPRLPVAPDAPPLSLLAKLRRRGSGGRAIAVPGRRPGSARPTATVRRRPGSSRPPRPPAPARRRHLPPWRGAEHRRAGPLPRRLRGARARRRGGGAGARARPRRRPAPGGPAGGGGHPGQAKAPGTGAAETCQRCSTSCRLASCSGPRPSRVCAINPPVVRPARADAPDTRTGAGASRRARRSRRTRAALPRPARRRACPAPRRSTTGAVAPRADRF
jgi:hypothetical protein